MNSIKKLFILLSIVITFTPTARGKLDSDKYITIDEIELSMPAYCLTVYKGSKIEKFPLEVISVIRNFEPGHDAILVKGTDKRFIHTGPVAGCSGSPVFIDGKLAGALAFGWNYSKDPLYGVTPIEEMLQVGENSKPRKNSSTGYSLDFENPLNLDKITDKILDTAPSPSRNGGMEPLSCPVVASGLSEKGLQQFNKSFADSGLFAVSGSPSDKSGQTEDRNDVPLKPGAVLAVPLVSGDVSLAVIGTATEMNGSKIYGFGHSFLGYGDVDLPIATGKVHTVVSTLPRSFKLASPMETVGALRADQETAVVGKIGEKAKQIPLTVTVDRYNDPEGVKKYECMMACNKTLSPNLLATVIEGTVTKQGSLSPYGSIRYDVKINLGKHQPVSFSNTAAESNLRKVASQAISSLGLLMNNPYKKVYPESIDVNVEVSDEDVRGWIWSVSASATEVEAGENIKLDIILEKALGGKKQYKCNFEVPKQLKPGRYKIIVCGANYYENFLRKMVPQKLTPENLKSLIKTLNYSLSVDTTKLYCMFVLPPEGITIERAELPGLPGTRALILADNKRTLEVKPYNRWLKNKIETDMVVRGHRNLKITLKK